MKRNTDEDRDFKRPAGRRKRGSWLKRGLLLLILLFVVGVAAGPTLLSSGSLVSRIVNSVAGIKPMQLSIGKVQLGWFSTQEVADLHLMDESGQTLVKIGSISSDKSLLGWLTGYSNIGTIHIDGTEATVVAGDGTTNIEQLLAAISGDPKAEETSDSDKTFALPRGNIQLTNTRVVLVEQGRAEQWLIDAPKITTQLPETGQLLGPTQASIRVIESSVNRDTVAGELVVTATQAADGSIQLQAKLAQLPLDIFHVLRARLPELPIEAASGRVSGEVVGVVHDAENFEFDLRQAQANGLAIQSATLIGSEPAKLQLLAASGQLKLANDRLALKSGDLACDFARIQASADLPWPLSIPTLQQPFQVGASLTASGVIDLPKMVFAAKTFMPMQPGTELIAGQLQFGFQHQANNAPLAQAKMVLSGLEAVANGSKLRWNDPVTIDLSAQSQQSGTSFGVGVAAEFCQLQGQGTIEKGTLVGDADLDLMYNRLSQFVALPIQSMAGNLKLNLTWDVDASQQVKATGTLKTAPVSVVTATGAKMNEPAWNGSFNAAIQLNQGAPTLLQNLRLEMLAEKEQLNLELQEPLNLVVDPRSSQSSAAFNLQLVGELNNLKHRALVWVSQPPDIVVDGLLKLSMAGRLDTKRVQILQANWDIQPLNFRYGDIGLSEQQILGNFKGNVDSGDFTKVVIEQLTMQSSSFSLLAKDQAGENSSRRGQANCVVDLKRLLKNVSTVETATSTQNNAGYTASGQVQAALVWAINGSGAEFRTQVSGKDIALLGPSSATPQPGGRQSSSQNLQAIWSEPQVNVAVDGRWDASTGRVRSDSIQLQTNWLSYQGNATYTSDQNKQDISVQGQAIYDATQLSQKISPMTGNNLQLFGKHQMPIQVAWSNGHSDAEASALKGLSASCRIGWEQARVVGIEVGKADVPVDIVAGVVTTAAEIPVSGGVLRWDVVSDLTQPTLVIQQKPMTVLENVAITREMCSGWLKYLAPLVAEATSIDGRLSLALSRAELTPMDLSRQTVEGQLVMHSAQAGPGPLSNEIIGLTRQLDQLRRGNLAQPVSGQTKAWLTLPQQQIAFAMVDGKVHHRDLKVDLGDATLTTAGAVGVNGQLEMMASMPIPDKWTERGPVLAALRGQTLQFPLRGTISKPAMDFTAIGQLGRQTIENAASNLLQQQLNRGLDKLFK